MSLDVCLSNQGTQGIKCNIILILITPFFKYLLRPLSLVSRARKGGGNRKACNRRLTTPSCSCRRALPHSWGSVRNETRVSRSRTNRRRARTVHGREGWWCPWQCCIRGCSPRGDSASSSARSCWVVVVPRPHHPARILHPS